MLLNHKRTVMAFCALQILIFHLWIIPGNVLEPVLFLKQTAYIGVDIFFLVSGYSLAGRTVETYCGFMKSRFIRVYVPFILFSVVAFFYFKWEGLRLLKVILGMELFEKGGGSFLWFLPGIMLIYSFFPLFQRWDRRNRSITLVVMSILWIGVAFLVTQFTGYSSMFILWNRLPIFFIGYYGYSLNGTITPRIKAGVGMALLIIGGLCLYQFGYVAKLNVPFPDMFYITAIPCCVGVALLVDFVKDISVIRWIGYSTLEIYGVQMIFGYSIANKLMFMTGNVMLTNLITLICVLAISVGIRYFFAYVQTKIMQSKKWGHLPSIDPDSILW